MLDSDVLAEAERQFTVCNACRYCEGLCSVFPAMEMRNSFVSGDVAHLANLCHDCRACLHACPFSPPHEMAINIPTLMSTIRAQSFEQHARPAFIWRLLGRSRVLASMVAIAIGMIALPVGAVDGLSKLTHSHRGHGAFYKLIGYVWLVVPGTVAGVLVLTAIAAGAWSSIGDSGAPAAAFFGIRPNLRALADALGLKNLRGGGGGCHSDEMSPSTVRRKLHNFVFYGFLLMIASTLSAAIEQDALNHEPPFRLLSVPVMLGTLGGIAAVIGCAGFALVGRRGSDALKSDQSRSGDRIFGGLLILTAGSGLLLLALRSTPLLSVALIVHLGIVGVFFIALPYSKFVHAAYRYLALVRFHAESKER